MIKKFLGTSRLLSATFVCGALALSIQGGDGSANAQTPPASDATASAAITPDAEAGAEIYSSVCKGCHGVSIAPTLRGIINRPIASVATFGGYSDGLKAKQSQTWTEENLNVFLMAPADFAPGTLMIKAIPDAQARADVIAYLATLPPPR